MAPQIPDAQATILPMCLGILLEYFLHDSFNLSASSLDFTSKKALSSDLCRFLPIKSQFRLELLRETDFDQQTPPNYSLSIFLFYCLSIIDGYLKLSCLFTCFLFLSDFLLKTGNFLRVETLVIAISQLRRKEPGM